jgi:F-type H+-transporting ATPase subunit delta
MISGSLAKRYAKGLYSATDSQADHDRFLIDLENITAALRVKDAEQNLQIMDVLRGRHISLTIRMRLVEAVGRRVGADPRVITFIKLLAERGRILGIDIVTRHFRDLADLAAGRIRTTIVTAQELNPSAVGDLRQALETSTGKKVLVDTRVDPELIGGVVLHFGSLTLDRSVRRSLATLRDSFSAE